MTAHSPISHPRVESNHKDETMDRRGFLLSASMLCGGLLTSKASGRNGGVEAPRPNILMITCHDIGQHLGCYGVRSVQTDNLDRLAARGIRFSHFYSTSAVCSPGRGSLHTGRYPQSNGLMGLTHAPWWWKLNENERHTAAILRDAGYETHLIGFNHIDGDTDRLGYEHTASEQRRASETVEAARQLIQEAHLADRPFFAKVGFTEVHRPFVHGTDTEKGVFVPPYLQSTEQVRSDLAALQATIRYFDQRVGEILDTLYTSRIAKNTLVIMTADHGIPIQGLSGLCGRPVSKFR